MQIELSLHRTGLGADDPLGDGALEPERAADGEDPFPDGQRVRIAQRDFRKLRGILVLDFQQGEVGEFVDGDDFDLFIALAFELAAILLIDLDRNLRLVFDDMEIRDQVSVFVDDEARTQSARRPHLDDGGAQLAD